MNHYAGKPEPQTSKKTSVGNKLASIKAIIVWVCLISLAVLFFSHGTKIYQVIAGLMVGTMALIFLLSRRENLTKNNTQLLVLALVMALALTIAGSFLAAVNLGRPLAHTDGFFKAAEVDFHREKLAYSKTGKAMFRIELTTNEFEKLLNYYRAEAQELRRLGEQKPYNDLLYFELEPASIDRENFFDSGDEVGGKPFAEHLQKVEPTDSAVLENAYWIKSALEKLMEGFPEIDDDLGRCRTIIWNASEVSVEFYWFEKQQKGYINP